MPRQVSKADWSLTANVTHIDNIRFLGVGHLTTQGLKQKRRSDWSGTQNQQWSDPYYQPQKTKFPYGMKWKDHNVDHRTGKTGRTHQDDDSGGQWYFEEDLIMTYAGDKRRYNSTQDGYTGGKILMTKQQAYEMGMTPQQVINWYNEDKLFYDSAKKTNTKPSLFFEYRKDGSITGKFKPPIIPPTTPATPPPVMTPPEPTPAPVAEPTPAPVAEPTPVGNLNPYQLTTTINPKWILLAIVGVGILSAMIFIMRGRK